MSVFSSFTKRYQPSSKTLRFTLIPQGKTQENIDKNGVLGDDQKRADNYKSVKRVLDEYYKQHIDQKLQKINYDWQPLFDAHQNYRSTKDDKVLQEVRGKCLKAVSKLISGDDKINPKSIIDKILNKEVSVSQEDYDAVVNFNRFTTYFEGYRENRENIFGEKQNSAPYRMVVENFSKFYANICKFNSLPEQTKQELSAHAQKVFGVDLSSMFSAGYYNNALSQKAIGDYNNVLGGYALQDGTKIQGLNELCNLKHQQKQLDKKVVFEPLYKQILSDKSTLLFVGESYSNDSELLQDLSLHLADISKTLNDKNNDITTVFASDQVDHNNVWVGDDQLPALSQAMGEKWHFVKEKIKKQKQYTVQQIQEVCEHNVFAKISDCYNSLVANFNEAYNAVLPVLNSSRILSYTEIKTCLDSIVALEKLLKIFVADDGTEKDDAFYSTFDGIYFELRKNVAVYNMVRNYATKKEYSEEKIKINFNSPTLAGGWDKNKEDANKSIILVREDKYYLGIYNVSKKGFLVEKSDSDEQHACYKKFNLKQLSKPHMDLPKAFLSKKGKKLYNPSEYILKNYEKGYHKKGEDFDKDFCHALIDYFKDGIAKNKDWQVFDFKFSPTQSYEDISQFYSEVTAQAYKMSYTYVDESQVDKLVDEGKLFLFQIYNKDFSSKSTGNKNLHTLYWQQIFSDQNIKSPIFQICGGAELFYRSASIDNPFVHKKGSVLIRKTNDDKTPVDPQLYQDAMQDAQNMTIEQLEQKYPTVKFRLAPHDITKNKRFTQAQYKFHCPIAFNYNSNGEENQKQFNQTVAKQIALDNEVNVIGIDRGERHLLYVSVVDKNGKIILQKSLNEINGVNYHDKLVAVAKNRTEQRKNWQTIENIKELKKGYLSLVVNEVSKLMVEYDAVVVMEQLNKGFKNSRVHIEQQAYQNFEIALLQKLNYLAFKDKQPNEVGGIANAYQLSAKYDSFDKVGAQSGFVFYVPANYTSKIDPATGFVNLFTSKHLKYENVKKSQEFFGKFNSICYDQKYGFMFEFSYDNFKTNDADKTIWQVCSGDASRVVYKVSDNKYEEVFVTEKIKVLFDAYGIALNSDIKEAVVQQNSKEFFEKLLWLFGMIVRLRYSNSQTDYILSPVLKDGKFFDSRKAQSGMPVDGDANGAYHIALKGLRLITKQIDQNGSIKLYKTGTGNKAWFDYAKTVAQNK